MQSDHNEALREALERYGFEPGLPPMPPLQTLYKELSALLRSEPGKDYESASKDALERLRGFLMQAESEAASIANVKKRMLGRSPAAVWDVAVTIVMYEPPSLSARYALIDVGDQERMLDIFNKEPGDDHPFKF